MYIIDANIHKQLYQIQRKGDFIYFFFFNWPNLPYKLLPSTLTTLNQSARKVEFVQ